MLNDISNYDVKTFSVTLGTPSISANPSFLHSLRQQPNMKVTDNRPLTIHLQISTKYHKISSVGDGLDMLNSPNP